VPLIAFASPKGGVGKTTLAAHAAALLARAGHKVIALDLDPQNALRLHLGVDLAAPGAFCARLPEKPAWRDCLVETPSGARLLPFGTLDPPKALDLAQALWREPALLADPLREMLAVPGLILVADSAPGPGPALAAIQPLADLQVLVLLADAGSAAMIPQIAGNRHLGRGTLAARAAERAVVVLNQVENGVTLSDAVLEMAEQALGPRLLGVVCRDDALAEALADRRMLLDGEEGAGEDLALLAEALLKRLRLAGGGAARARQEPPGLFGPNLFDWGRM
jgi:cellulose synthase operon protein YhjQ